MLVPPGTARTVERRPRGAGTRGSPGIRERTSGALDRRGSLARGLRSGQAGEGARHHGAGCRPGDRSLRPASRRRPGDSRHGLRTFDDDGQLIPSCSVHRVPAGQSGPGPEPDSGSGRDRNSCVPTRRFPRRHRRSAKSSRPSWRAKVRRLPFAGSSIGPARGAALLTIAQIARIRAHQAGVAAPHSSGAEPQTPSAACVAPDAAHAAVPGKGRAGLPGEGDGACAHP